MEREEMIENGRFEAGAAGWEARQKVHLEPGEAGITVRRAQPGSTPGLVQRVAVAPGRRYRFAVRGSANSDAFLLVADPARNRLVRSKTRLPHEPDEVAVVFETGAHTELVVGVLFSAPPTDAAPADPAGPAAAFHLREVTLAEAPAPAAVDGVYAGLASIPSRAAALETAVASLYDQIDHLFVYLNDYARVPDALRDSRITVYRSRRHGDLRDSGKFFGLREVGENSLYLTADDDLTYPEDYRSRLEAALDRYGRRAAVGVHGLLFPPRPTSFFKRVVLHFRQALDADVPVSALGTGTAAFHTSLIRPDPAEFEHHGMADLLFARALKRRNAPLIAVARPADWLREPDQTAEPTLFEQTRQDQSAHVRVLAEAAPWGAGAVLGAVEAGLAEGTGALDPAVADFLRFGAWLEGTAKEPRLAPPGPVLRQLAALAQWPHLLTEAHMARLHRRLADA